MSTVGQSLSTSIRGVSAAAIAERSAGVACTLEKPGIDPNQSVEPLMDEQPASAVAAVSRAAAAHSSPRNRSTEYALPALPIDLPDVRTAIPLPALIAAQPWRSQGRAPRYSTSRVVPQPGIEQVVLPHPVDAEVLAGKSLAPEPGPFQKPDRGGVAGDAGRLDPMQPQRTECERQQRADRCRHVPLPCERRAHPVAEAAGLRAAAPDIGEREAADQHAVVPAEDEERIGEVAALI